MAATTKVKDVLRRSSILLSDMTPQFNRWTEAEMIDWLNDGQLAIAKYLPAAFSNVVTIKLRQGTVQTIDRILMSEAKLADGSSPTADLHGVRCLDFYNNMGADGLTPGAAIPPPVARRILDQQRPNWHTQAGPVVYQVMYDPQLPRQFLVQPGVPASPAVWLRIGAIFRPTLITNAGTPESPVYHDAGSSTTVISLNDEYVEDLVNYICARAYMKNAEYTADPQRAASFASLFINSLNATVTALTGTNPNLKRLPFAPEPIGAAS